MASRTERSTTRRKARKAENPKQAHKVMLHVPAPLLVPDACMCLHAHVNVHTHISHIHVCAAMRAVSLLTGRGAWPGAKRALSSTRKRMRGAGSSMNVEPKLHVCTRSSLASTSARNESKPALHA